VLQGARGRASSPKRRFDRRQRHDETHSQPFIAQALEFTRDPKFKRHIHGVGIEAQLIVFLYEQGSPEEV
jgi:hypothetical protein